LRIVWRSNGRVTDSTRSVRPPDDQDLGPFRDDREPRGSTDPALQARPRRARDCWTAEPAGTETGRLAPSTLDLNIQLRRPAPGARRRPKAQERKTVEDGRSPGGAEDGAVGSSEAAGIIRRLPLSALRRRWRATSAIARVVMRDPRGQRSEGSGERFREDGRSPDASA
jgi:hypothetical protein